MTTTILQLERIPIYPPTNGRERRVWETAKTLASFGMVHLVGPGMADSTPNLGDSDEVHEVEFVDLGNPLLGSKLPRIHLWSAFQSVGSSNPYDWLQSRITLRTVRSLNLDVDVVVVESPQMATAARTLAADHDAALLVNKHNASYEILERFLSSSPVPGVLADRAVSNLKAFEQAVVDDADAVVYQSPVDRERFDPPADGRVETIPNGTDVDAIREGGDPAAVAADLGVDVGADVCVFVGSYDYVANQQAAQFVADKVAPRLPDTEFVLAGRNPPKMAGNNVHTPGFVDDLAGTLTLADVGLCPIMLGSGTNLKILDYMAAGLPTVTTELGTTGLDVEDGESVVVAETSSEFVDAIERIESDDALRARLAANATELGDAYDWDALMAEYKPILEEVLGQRVDG